MKEQKDFQEKFLDIVRYYNEVVRSDNIIFDERRVIKYEHMAHDIENQRSKIDTSTACTPTTFTTSTFYNYLLCKVLGIRKELSMHDKKLSFFYLKYKKIFDRCSVAVIIMSSSLTFIESVSLTLNPVTDENTGARIVSLTFSTLIAIVTAVLKFKNIKEKIESIVKAKEKIHNCQAKLFNFDKELKTTLFMSDSTKDGEECTPISRQQSP